MSKELEIFENIMKVYGNTNSLEGTYDDFLIIKKALQRLEAIDNAGPSKAIEYLDHIKENDFNMMIATYPPLPAYNGITKGEMFTAIEQSLVKAHEQEEDIIHYKGTVDNLRRDNALLKDIKDEQEKVLKIIKEKCVNVWYLMKSKTVEEYNSYLYIECIEDTKIFILTSEEFDSLKKYME